ncbi:MAG: PIN domain-containing protein, partial [Candidatus Diapherotrites archaeon]|nr:PIN domain-containing protein [Candidatus Diapherotrites archaeon]
MNDECFLDTNILVYAFDQSDESKYGVAKRIVSDIMEGKRKGVISNQILGELFTVLTSKVRAPLSRETAQSILNGLIDSPHWRKIKYSVQTVQRAV